MHCPPPLALALLMGLASCEGQSPNAEAKTTVPQAGVSVGAARIAKHMNAPTNLEFGDHVEERIGDGNLGPSDLKSFTHLKFPADSIRPWTPSSERLTARPPYAQPKEMTSWVDEATFRKLEFYRASPLLGASDGWIGLSRSTGEIYVFTFTS